MFRIVRGDIRDFRGDFIINPSNTTLMLGSGVSGILRLMCPSLQKEMNEYVNKHGYLNPGDIAITIYPCEEYKWAIHAAVMDYRSDKVSPDYRRIEKILENIVKYLDDKEVEVITPLLGTGVGGLDKERVLEMMKRYFKNLKANVTIVLKK